VDRDSTRLSAISGALARTDSPAFVRALLRASGDGWVVNHAWAAVTPDPPPGWEEQTWRYEQVAFVACATRATDLAALSSPDGGTIALAGIQGSVPAARDSAVRTHRPSFARHDPVVLPWPATEFRLTAAEEQPQLPHDTLIGGSSPSFPEPQSAWRAFFEGDFSLSGAGAPPTELAVIRLADTRAWLGSIHVTATQLTVQVHGHASARAQLELFSTTNRAEQLISGPGPATFALENGLPPDAWLWLKRGMEWLDYRAIDARSGWAANLERAGVTFDIPTDPQASIEALLSAGEGPDVEFKRELPTTAEQKRKQLKTVAAFATGDGGVMVFGIDPDELTIVGLGGDDPKELRDHLYALVHRTVMPSPSVIVEDHRVDGKTILVLRVEPGLVPPYGIAADKGSRDKPEYFVRRGSSTYPAQPGELRQAARDRPPMERARRAPFGPW